VPPSLEAAATHRYATDKKKNWFELTWDDLSGFRI